ncbi:hypothetical protein ACO2Q2_02710 [Dyella sp. KRB-257]|uniref:hypothetical protein n=1 Tax=Dyella sp. KRB-257 TaxID=3400915 RepID=UPI003C0F7EEB
MKPHLPRPRITPDMPAVVLSTETRGTANATTPALHQHRDYDGRDLDIGPPDHLDCIENSERFAIH